MKRTLLVVALGFLACTRGRTGSGSGCSTAGEVDCRPPISATALDGSALNEDRLGGKVVLINFWATWCKPCALEMPDLEAVFRRHADQGFVVVGLITGDRGDDLDIYNFAAARGVTYPLARSNSELEQKHGMGGVLPMSVLYDRTGKLQARWNGQITEEQLEAKVLQILAR